MHTDEKWHIQRSSYSHRYLTTDEQLLVFPTVEAKLNKKN